jgi:hypothetical protein
MHSWCITSLLQWSGLHLESTLFCLVVVLVHHEYFEHFPNFNYFAGKLPSWNFSCTTIC